MPTPSIEVTDLRRVFKLDRFARTKDKRENVALEELNLEVKKGELFGLLGPNGAGKTTTIRILCTLLSPSAGSAHIEGLDVVKDVWRVRKIINSVSGGDSCGYGVLTARENLRLFTELYGIPWKVAAPRVDEMLKVVGLEGNNSRINKFSTGMRQRVNFARGFTTDPHVLFLDEPTVGLDVHSAMNIRQFVKRWLGDHPEATILLTTHYMAEADEMCDRVAIIDKGRVQACDTPTNLKRMVQQESALEITIGGTDALPDGWKDTVGISKASFIPDAESDTSTLRVLFADPEAGSNLLRVASSSGRRLISMRTIEPTLEDVFLKLTGRRLGEEDGKGAQ